jgi:hypothetical protein
MNEFEFWTHMQQHGRMAAAAWYTSFATVAFAVAVGAFLLMVVALRRQRSPLAVFGWLLLASLPTILALPAAYVSLRPGSALALVGFTLPATTQAFPLAAARQIGGYLDILARAGQIGAGLTLATLFAAAASGVVGAPPAIQRFTSTVTRGATRVFNRGRAPAAVGKYGALKVMSGPSTGTTFAVSDALTIGKQEADITLTDAVVSRRHARVSVAGQAAQIADQHSTNGTFLLRSGQTLEVGGTPFDLQPGDVIVLGPPMQPTSVRLQYERNGV